jgi:hypothetical protein
MMEIKGNPCSHLTRAPVLTDHTALETVWGLAWEFVAAGVRDIHKDSTRMTQPGGMYFTVVGFE